MIAALVARGRHLQVLAHLLALGRGSSSRSSGAGQETAQRGTDRSGHTAMTTHDLGFDFGDPLFGKTLMFGVEISAGAVLFGRGAKRGGVDGNRS